MKALGWLLFAIMANALMLGGTAWAQNVGDNSFFFTTYYSHANTAGAPDQTLRVINDGDTGANLWASVYVFDDSQELQECCSCEVSPDGLTSESVNNNLTANSLTRKVNTRGVIKVISSCVAAGGPTNFTNKPAAGLRVWSTHIQRTTPTAGTFYVTETQAADSNRASGEETLLETLCLYVNLLGGGGQGVCTCTPEDFDF
jgi:hypothetical protein